MSKEAWEKYLAGEANPSERMSDEEYKKLIEEFMEWVWNHPGRPDEHISCWCPACRPEIWGKK